ncbi:TPA: prefoldin subunit alpha [Candidatus Woesearchaeota archaeon]|nr:prefoldin subunit alpha [uncultured archaeon]HIH04882.1 prefoldin subunit alpha [Candidatus Woesearchaeota archaeon]HII63929.1 prefoldin subunit alpha [Candidatus Woesearchaeota archaeon]HII65704.1 prefoldin subunit alpha [Candidatus Woesearchaeota archaeon]HIJ18268.1 prefoldin subunit alpha [Candidatus Woesearchaeota archaeon]
MTEQNEQKAQEMYVELQLLTQHVKQLRQQQELLEQQIMEMAAATQSLDEFGKAGEGAEMFVPLSSGVFAKAKIIDTKNFLMNVGAGTCVVKDAASAKKLMEQQLEESRKLSEKMAMQVERFSRKAVQLQRQLQSLLPAE